MRDYRLEGLKHIYEEIVNDITMAIGRSKCQFSLLDVGCGYGYFLRTCSEHGFRCLGVDISKYALHKLKNTKIVTVLADAQSGLPLKSDSVDIVIMLEVIEHLKRPHKTLQEISRVLKSNGILYVTTPNSNALGRFIMRDKWYGFLDETHRILFSPLSLRNFIESEGFKVIRIYEPFLIPVIKQISVFSRLGLGGQIRLLAEKI